MDNNPSMFLNNRPNQGPNKNTAAFSNQQNYGVQGYPRNPPAQQRNNFNLNSGYGSNNNPINTNNINNSNDNNNNNNNTAGDFIAGVAKNMGMDSTLTKMGLGYTSQILDTGKENISRYISIADLRYYFNVNNSYVINKLKILLCPYIHSNYPRQSVPKPDTGEIVPLPPRDDINAPDLYIPTMAFVTYVLIVGLTYGLNNRFSPDLLGTTASLALIVLLLEILVIKLGFYLLNTRFSIPIFDIVAFCGYKFVGIVVNTTIGMILGRFLYYVAFIYTSFSMAYFMLRTLRLLILPENTVLAQTSYTQASWRKYLLFFVLFLQILLSYVLGAPPKATL